MMRTAMVRLGHPLGGRLLTAGLGLLLLVLVAAGTRAGTQTLPNPAGPAMTVVTLAAETLVLCALVAGALILIANIWVLFPLKKRRLQSRPNSFLRTVASALFLVAVAYLVSAWRLFRHGRAQANPAAGRLLNNPPPASGGMLFHTGYEWIPVVATLLLIAVGMALVLTRLGGWVRIAPVPAPPPAEAAMLTGALDAALESLHHARDPRQAVIAAYLILERHLADHGIPRRRSETPAEFLQRVLGPLAAVAAPLRRLTELFEMARYSHRPMPESCRQDAAAALAAVQRSVATSRPAA